MRFNQNRLKFYYQLESTDCGPACLTMIANFYGKKYSVKEIKQLCSITRMGVAVQDIVNGAKQIKFESIAVKLTLEDLESDEVPLPAILFWKQDHFVVLYKVKQKKATTVYYLADPAYGKISLEAEIFYREWKGANEKGIAVLVTPADNFHASPIPITHEQPITKTEFFQPVVAFLRQKKISYFFTLLLLLAGMVANWAMPILFQKTIDEGIVNKSLQVVIILLIAQFGLFLGNFIADFTSHWVLTKINFKLSILLKENFLHKLMKLPVSYFDTRLNTDTLQRLSDQTKIQNFVTWKGIELLLDILNITAFSTILFFINKVAFLIYLVFSILLFYGSPFF